jgi:hypothetical protein
MTYGDTCFVCDEYTQHDFNSSQCVECTRRRAATQGRRFNFVIFKNYDGSVTGQSIPRAAYDRIMLSSSAV